MKKWYDINKQTILCYLTEVGDKCEYVSFTEAAKRCNVTVDKLVNEIKLFESDGYNVFIDYDTIAANK